MSEAWPVSDLAVPALGLTPTRLRGGWWVARDAQVLVLARCWPPRWDVAARSVFPLCARLRLAQQIRQDMWRGLQRLRGFQPVVCVARDDHGMTVTAGGALPGPHPHGVADAIAEILADPARRRRWIAHATRRG